MASTSNDNGSDLPDLPIPAGQHTAGTRSKKRRGGGHNRSGSTLTDSSAPPAIKLFKNSATQDEVDGDLALLPLPEGVTYGWLADYVYRNTGMPVDQACRSILSEPCLVAHAGTAIVQRQIRSIVVAMVFAYRRMALTLATVYKSGLHEDVAGGLSWRACCTELAKQDNRSVPYGLSDTGAPAVRLPNGWHLLADPIIAPVDEPDYADVDDDRYNYASSDADVTDDDRPQSPDTQYIDNSGVEIVVSDCDSD